MRLRKDISQSLRNGLLTGSKKKPKRTINAAPRKTKVAKSPKKTVSAALPEKPKRAPRKPRKAPKPPKKQEKPQRRKRTSKAVLKAPKPKAVPVVETPSNRSVEVVKVVVDTDSAKLRLLPSFALIRHMVINPEVYTMSEINKTLSPLFGDKIHVRFVPVEAKAGSRVLSSKNGLGGYLYAEVEHENVSAKHHWDSAAKKSVALYNFLNDQIPLSHKAFLGFVE